MKNLTLKHLHDWKVSINEAKSIQANLSKKVILRDKFSDIHYVAGTDVGLVADKKSACGVVVVLNYPELEIVDYSVAYRQLEFPYIPGFLSFREAPVLLDAFKSLQTIPSVIICDGQGIAHPRCFGLACHLGILTGLPAIGVAKSRLIGKYDIPSVEKGSKSTLFHNGRQIGTVLRTRTGIKPVFVSPGHLVSFNTASALTLACCTRFRLPETTRQAHNLATKEAKKVLPVSSLND